MNIIDYVLKQQKYQNVLNSITSKNNQNIYIGNAASNISMLLAVACYEKTNDFVIYVCENTYEATKAYEALCDMLSSDCVCFFPVEEFISSTIVASSSTFRLARMYTLYNIISNNKKIIVTCTEGITRRMMSKGRIASSIIKLKTNMTYNMQTLEKDLVNRGYKKCAITEEMGTFSKRGSIIDIYPINADDIFRINFFDDEIETIKKVDLETQMSKERCEELIIFPLYDMYYTDEEYEKIAHEIRQSSFYNQDVEHDLINLKNYNCIDQLYIYIPYIDKANVPFLDLINTKTVFYSDISSIFKHEKASLEEIASFLGNIKFKGTSNYFLSISDAIASSNKNIFLNPYMESLNDIKLDQLININTTNNFEYNNNIKHLIEDINFNKNKTYIITHFDSVKLNFIKETFTTNNIEVIEIERESDIVQKKVNLVISTSMHGFVDLDLQTEIITPYEYSPGKINKGTKYAKFYKNATKIYNKDELKPGDYVIHQDYGVGIYEGIKTVELRGNKNDYLSVRYANDGKLLIPVANLYLIEKYNTSKDLTPKLNDINGKEWKKKKAKVREKVMEVAQKLIKIQAERETKQGFVYKSDTTDQLLFEEDFNYNETKDQIDAINAVKRDMESTKPLDRLICGDVGFGKTEVAMRAAFKAVENGKQVAYLAPTTVLTRQHYYTFKDRFEKYGIRVELLNRFVPLSKQKLILENLKKGYVDIVIGTHRILSKDIVFKDLGLLIIDEEQRFGVMHKERIKELKANVDVLTLTATPIPRTLQMSLSGLKDFSLIETPPNNRLPVQTFVLENNDSVVREAINRELARGGQVFYLLNRIEELDIIADKIHRLVPKAKIGTIHGKMDKDLIEDTLIHFLDKEYDILVCTTIIETGIDIPNANTLIIECADYLGLSQLYQIRGRVGRSDRISYAYLMYDKNKILTENSRKRLDAIKEFTALGSGYKIAMRDLAIRGAGDILGDEQSGFIDAIGMELYMKLLNEAIAKIKGEEVKEEENSYNSYNINVSRHIDSTYVSDDEIRIIMHQEIGKIKSREQINQLIYAYTDRYGKLSEEILLYMEEKYLEFLLKSKGVEQIKEKDDEIYLNFDPAATSKLNFKQLGSLSKEIAPKFYFTFKDNRLYITIYKHDYPKSYIYTLTSFLEKI